MSVLLAALLSVSLLAQAQAQPRDNRREVRAPIRVLPSSHQRLVHNGHTYFYNAGRFYRQSNGLYFSISAPLGAIIPSLPQGIVTVGVETNRYFYGGGVYYRKAPSGYVVIEEPQEAQSVLASDGADKLIVYPAAGQSDEQKSQDRFECYEWASDETNFDPTDAGSDQTRGADYKRAMSACLEARDYVVK